MDKLDKYKYSYEWTPNYCYKDTDISINTLNMTKKNNYRKKHNASFKIYQF